MLTRVGCAVLAAPPGSGKTTTIPLALLDESWLRGKKIVMLEPRRVAARAAAARMASLMDEAVGQTIGYQIRFERKVTKDTRIEVITEGLLTRRLQADPELPGVGLVIFDEFHERSLDADLALALSLQARENLNPELRLLVMSATLETQRVAKLLGDAPVLEAGGRLYPVDIRHHAARTDEPLDAVVANGVLMALQETAGDVLAFLPGVREIRGVQRRLEARTTDIAFCPLYGDLSSAEQDAALQPDPRGRRKVILATNIAQTSLTVEGVTTVVDGGFARVARFDLGGGANRLETQRISRASAEQRAGRAGRLGPGVCYRMWSREQHGALPAHDTPEILAADLSRFALELATWGVDAPSALALMDAPPAVNWNYARELLCELGALDEKGRISAHGRELGRLPTPPRRGHMLLKARDAGLGGLAAWVAAALDERDAGAGSADLAAGVQQFLHGRGADPQARRRVAESARQLMRLVEALDTASADDRDIARIVAWAYPERIAQRRVGARVQKEVAYLCEDGGEARIQEHDPLAQSEWLAIAHWDPGSPRKIRLAVALKEDDLLRDHAERIVQRQVVHWDGRTEAVVAESQKCLGAIVLERRPLREGAGEPARVAMLEGIRAMGLQALPWNEAARAWQARVLSLRTWRSEESWPDVSDVALLATLQDWLAPFLDGITRRDHLARLDLATILESRLDYAAQQKLNRLAPTHLDVPTGSRIRLEYQASGPPVLAVKLQELFGCIDTPTVNEGRIKVLLHLLSPGQRPVAVTQDLAGFWARSYPEVKKELKGRYPRHPWPDDPLHAAPTRRAKPRGT